MSGFGKGEPKCSASGRNTQSRNTHENILLAIRLFALDCYRVIFEDGAPSVKYHA